MLEVNIIKGSFIKLGHRTQNGELRSKFGDLIIPQRHIGSQINKKFSATLRKKIVICDFK